MNNIPKIPVITKHIMEKYEEELLRKEAGGERLNRSEKQYLVAKEEERELARMKFKKEEKAATRKRIWDSVWYLIILSGVIHLLFVNGKTPVKDLPLATVAIVVVGILYGFHTSKESIK